ncbi:MAG: AAA family ATPase [Verrucomicrobiota bacterium]
MRLISLTIRNYRVHRDLTVEFDPERNLIGGPNETGKSTLAEAIHRALFMRYKSGGDLQKSMVSDTHGGQPEVRLTFECAGDTWTIEKHFAGSARGSARLISVSGISLQGDAAEDKLAELTGNAAGSTNNFNQLSTRWSHLWVWQGTAGADASEHAMSHRSELIQRLQENGLAAVMQSETDNKTREKIQTIHETIFTRTGTIKTGSRLDLAAKSLNEATTKLNAAHDQKSRLESAINEQESATREMAVSEAALPELREQLDASITSLSQARELGAQLENQKLIHSQATVVLGELTKADQQIRALITKAASAHEALTPAQKEIANLSEQVAAIAKKAEQAEIAANTSAAAIRTGRQLYDLSAACVTHFEKTIAHEALSAKSHDVAAIEQSLTDDSDALAQLPPISQSQLDSLRELEAQQAQAQSALEAMATGIELMAANHVVLLNGEVLTTGHSRVITETSELSLADGTRLRIQPGGGNSLALSRQKVADLKNQVATLLDKLSLTDSTQAAAIVTQRQTLEQKISNTQARLNDLGARDLPDALAAAANDLAMAKAEVERRRASISAEPALELPTTLDAAKNWRSESQTNLLTEEQREQDQRRAVIAAQQSHQERLAALQFAQQSLDGKRREISDLEASTRTLEQIHGDATARTETIAAANAKEATAKAALDTTQESLANLNPERLAQEVSRLERVISNEQNKVQDASQRIAVAQNILATDGTSDPEANLLQAMARHAAASDEHAREKRHADAIALLHQLFADSQQAISQSVTQPIATRVASYLECIFGRGVRVDVDWNDPNQKATIRITRPGAPTFAFDSLSGGAKEQVAAAVRLATAEILATAHNGTLPILFDDSFAFSDDTRIQALQSMLDLAAARGLQVLVLSCTPAAYTGFGAHETRLTPVATIIGRRFPQTEPNDAEAAVSDITPTLSNAPLPENAEALFLEALRSLGNCSGNQTLRSSLGWDEPSYDQVKASLIAQNLIATGRGRGGSVALLS